MNDNEERAFTIYSNRYPPIFLITVFIIKDRNLPWITKNHCCLFK